MRIITSHPAAASSAASTGHPQEQPPAVAAAAAAAAAVAQGAQRTGFECLQGAQGTAEVAEAELRASPRPCLPSPTGTAAGAPAEAAAAAAAVASWRPAGCPAGSPEEMRAPRCRARQGGAATGAWAALGAAWSWAAAAAAAAWGSARLASAARTVEGGSNYDFVWCLVEWKKSGHRRVHMASVCGQAAKGVGCGSGCSGKLWKAFVHKQQNGGDGGSGCIGSSTTLLGELWKKVMAHAFKCLRTSTRQQKLSLRQSKGLPSHYLPCWHRQPTNKWRGQQL
eukprot:1161875-Pelagomonas_calceolata.AAC.14